MGYEWYEDRGDRRRSGRGRLSAPVIDGPIESGEMTGERKMWLAATLLGIAERDPTYVVWTEEMTHHPERKAVAVAEAQEWYDSPAFDDCCAMAGVKPEFLRRLSSKEAREAYTRLMFSIVGDPVTKHKTEQTKFAIAAQKQQADETETEWLRQDMENESNQCEGLPQAIQESGQESRVATSREVY